MGAAIAILAGLFFAAAVYLMLSRSLLRILLGVVILGNGINLLILTAGRLARATPPILPEGVTAPTSPVVNPLPQALILTAIVIGFALFVFLLTLAYRTHQTLGTSDTDAMRRAEPVAPPDPPLSY